MDSAKFLHPWLIAIFLGLFTIMALIGLLRLVRERRYFGSVLLVLAVFLFGYSTWIAATLKL
ncbi:hypothetical protein [Alicyclobacillus sp. SO9]|uniref:hypothetical protein n=1 Tax=Alicyclobacillus sp. SO9 TaxID=2665646 RepID=UPI0018E7BAF3|nr:hypothetical protein [Alicyclobacillus sp. SO9]QQE79420.1 hypothetical protein GI364_02640 [Alicyclobacillus sp. SO9]